MYKNAMKNTKPTAVMEIKCGGGGVCVFVCVQVHLYVCTPTRRQRGPFYMGWS